MPRPRQRSLSTAAAALGRKGGKAGRGKAKVRGSRAYYQRIARKGLLKRWGKRKRRK